MKVAVTGATGFVGRHVVAELERRSIETVLAVRPSSHEPERRPGQQIVQLDVSKPGVNPHEVLHRPDVLIHLAWGGLPNYKSSHHIEEELPTQYRFLRRLVESGLNNVVIAGTCAEYGMQSGCLSEDMPTQPVHPYGAAKDLLRRQMEELQRARPFSLTWARLFYTYGEGQNEKSLFPQIRRAVLRRDRAFRMSSGEQVRDYLPVGTVAQFLVALALTGSSNGVVNVSSGKGVTVRSVVEGWIEQHGWDIELDLGAVPHPDYEPMAFWGDRRKLDRLVRA